MNPTLLRFLGMALLLSIGLGSGLSVPSKKEAATLGRNQISLQQSASGTTKAVPAQPSPGAGTKAIPATPAVPGDGSASPSDNSDCNSVPYPYHKIRGTITSITGITADVSLYPSDITGFIRSISGNGTDTANRIEIRSLFETGDGVLFAAGSDYLWSEFRSLPSIYRSADQGETWTTTSVPTDNSQSTKFVNNIAEDARGVLWAVGMPGVLKSTDGGRNWTKVNVSFTPHPGGDYFAAQTYRDLVRNVVALEDNSVLITVPFYSIGIWGYAYTNVYRSTNGGATWNLLFTQKQVDIITMVEAHDGALVFTDQEGRIYRFAEGAVTQVMIGNPRNMTAGPFLKTRNGTLYYVLNEEKVFRGSTEVVPTVYRSSDNGLTWRKIGNLPSGSSLISYGDLLAEGDDGQLYLAIYTNCWSGMIYQSSNQGIKWEIASGNVPELSLVPGPSYWITAIESIGGKIIHGGSLGGVIFTTP